MSFGFMNEEYKETAARAIKLDKQLRRAIKDLFHNEHSDRAQTTMTLLIAIERNIQAVIILLSVTYKGERVGQTFKMPIGLLLRSCCINAIPLSYFQQLDDNSLAEEEKNRDIEYSGSLPDRLEVYKDQVRSVDIDMSEDRIRHLFELNLEDKFLDGLHLDFDETVKDLKASRPTWAQKEEMGIEYGKGITNMFKKAKNKVPSLIPIYSYYKYFSQYEHYSSRGFGDAFEKCDSDNIYLPGAVKALQSWLNAILFVANNK